VFQISASGVFATLHSFTYLESGPQSYSALVQGTNGNFYIACEGAGSSYNPGTILCLTVPPVFLSMTKTGNAWNFSWNGQTGQRYQLQWNSNLNDGGWSNLGVSIVTSGPTIHGTDVSPVGNQRFYRVVALP
jgi:hypothetical protein